MSLVCEGAEYFFKIPDVVWSGVLAALITLAGVWLANKNSRKQLLMQQVHATAEKNRERQMQLRREVLLDAAAWANAVVLSVGNLLLLAKPLKETEKLLSLADTPTRVLSTGNTNTVKAFNDMLLTHTRALSNLTPRRGKIEDAGRRMHELRNALEQAEDDGHRKELKATIATLRVEVPAFFQDTLNVARELERLQVPLIVAIRDELGFPTDAEFVAAFEKVGIEQVGMMEEMVKGVLEGYGIATNSGA
jgi:hypothetical protein